MSRTFLPTRVMILMLIATKGESVISTPILERGEPTGPIEKGITYMVLPFMAPSKRWLTLCLISAGGTQLLVGPASSCFSEQMKVEASDLRMNEGKGKKEKKNIKSHQDCNLLE